ncbi:hypothetical protein SI65_09917 [Aspergillus cristatus]|uniref:Uncharacterized protein n=1 Tax=Aspergillus cristatus TaxID=573508 RepID=A0A1E3B1C8_ASPCR|nr:hypothetical protein SI65_09917 [Aspergillus cristatus]
MTIRNGPANGTANGISNGLANGKTNGAGAVKNGHLNGNFSVDEVAISANSPEKVPGLLKDILANGLAFSVDHDTSARSTLLDAARSLVHALETPRETMIRYCWSQSTTYAAIETGVDLGLFAILSRDDRPKSAAYLSEETGADLTLLARLLKHLSAVGVVDETGPDEYRRTGFSITLGVPRYSDAYACMTGCITDGVLALPAYLRKNNHRNPTNGIDCPFQLGFRTDSHFFEFLRDHPEHASQFNNHMSAYHQGRPSWMDVGFYPVPELVKELKESDGVLLVDVGGSLGHDLSEFQRKWPDMPGRLVLQDLPAVVEQAQSMSLHPRVEVMPHDFFTEQPVKGARAYYMHSILHDWNDDNCRKILSNLVPAMKRGYSKVLINENVIPDTNAYWETTSLDIIMMANFASQERTERHWHCLVESVGLKITNIWTAQRGVESLIECELA